MRMHTATLSAPNGSQPKGGCPRRWNYAHRWSKNRVCSKLKRMFKTMRGATTLPLRRRSQRGPQGFAAAILDGLAGGTTPPYALQTGGCPRSSFRSGGIGRPPFLPAKLRGPAGHAKRGAALYAWPAGLAGVAQTPQSSLSHMWRPVGRSLWTDNRGCGRGGAQRECV